MLTKQEIENELNARDYWKEGITYPAPPLEQPVILPIELPISLPTEPAILPSTPPASPAGLFERFGSLAIVSLGVLFLLAIFPGQADDLIPSGNERTETGGAV